jgi:hypothetical protein
MLDVRKDWALLKWASFASDRESLSPGYGRSKRGVSKPMNLVALFVGVLLGVEIGDYVHDHLSPSLVNRSTALSTAPAPSVLVV